MKMNVNELRNFAEDVDAAVDYLHRLIVLNDPHAKTTEGRRMARLQIRLLDLAFILENLESN